jgi:hypothetical protein
MMHGCNSKRAHQLEAHSAQWNQQRYSAKMAMRETVGENVFKLKLSNETIVATVATIATIATVVTDSGDLAEDVKVDKADGCAECAEDAEDIKDTKDTEDAKVACASCTSVPARKRSREHVDIEDLGNDILGAPSPAKIARVSVTSPRSEFEEQRLAFIDSLRRETARAETEIGDLTARLNSWTDHLGWLRARIAVMDSLGLM